jgi:hypothetical protein
MLTVDLNLDHMLVFKIGAEQIHILGRHQPGDRNPPKSLVIRPSFGTATKLVLGFRHLFKRHC